MLQPTDRKHLFESLRPPDGYQLDFAIGTTFSLDLTTLLTVPIGFAFLDYDGTDDGQGPDPLLILESIRQFAGKMAVFAQAGHIYVPKAHPVLNAYLEDAVYQVQAPSNDGVFHAKVWLLRFVPMDHADTVCYRLLCLSRNLTFDKSWDTAVSLDGQLEQRTNAFSRNRPLSAFIHDLPRFSINPVQRSVSRKINNISDEILRTRFELPEGIEECYFWTMGIEPERKFNKRLFEWPVRAIISPFLCDGFIEKAMEYQSEKAILISRKQALDGLRKSSLDLFEQIFTFDDGANEAGEESENKNQATILLAGLHAKLFIMERGWYASIVTGSANATMAAFTKNVEFMVELVGKKSAFGVDRLLGRIEGETSIADMLLPYLPPDSVVLEDQGSKLLEQKLMRYCRVIATTIQSGVLSSGDEDDSVHIEIAWKCPLEFSDNVETKVICRPITLPEINHKEIGPDTTSVSWNNVSVENLTAFIAFRVSMKSEHNTMSHEFVIKVALSGIPKDRLARVIGVVLQNQQEFLRLLMIILTMEGMQQPGTVSFLGIDPIVGSSGGICITPNGLLEMLLMAVSRDPRRIERISELVADLRRTETGTKLFPDGFEQIWNPIIEAMEVKNG